MRAGISNLERKAIGYQEYAQTRAYQRAWEAMPDFRVIFVLPTMQRVMNFAQKLHDRELPFKRFWLTDSSALELNEPQRIFQPVFLTPRNFHQERRYSFLDCWAAHAAGTDSAPKTHASAQSVLLSSS